MKADLEKFALKTPPKVASSGFDKMTVIKSLLRRSHTVKVSPRPAPPPDKGDSSPLTRRRTSIARRASIGDSDLASLSLVGATAGEGGEWGWHLTEVDVVRLATIHRLEVHEVSTILRCFQEADPEQSGALTRPQFRGALERLLDATAVPEGLLESAWTAITEDEDLLEYDDDDDDDEETFVRWEAALDQFCQWYMANLFGAVALARQSKSEAIVMSAVQDHQASPVAVEKLKATFDHFDLDGSGVIDYNEFRNMLAVLLRIADERDLSRDRVYRFWKEIDRDNSGAVDFLEFCAWYLKYFRPDGEATSTSIDGGGLLGRFYSSYDPGRMRANLVAHAHDMRYREFASCEF
jgi:hypothetical protein